MAIRNNKQQNKHTKKVTRNKKDDQNIEHKQKQ